MLNNRGPKGLLHGRWRTMKPLIPYFEPFSIPLPFDLPIVGHRDIYGFGILVAMGFIFGARMSQNKAERDGQDPELINRLVGWLVLGVFVGGHLGHAIMYDPQYFWENPKELLSVWSGLSSFGGFVGCGAVTYWFFKREDKLIRKANKKRKKAGEPLQPRISILGYFDTLFYGFTLGWFFGRMGCFSAHDHPGLPTEFWLGVPGMCDLSKPEIACHDLGLYEAIWALVMVLVVIVLDKKPRFPGFFSGLFILSYVPVRFVLDMFRDPFGDARYFGFTPAQYGSVLALFIGIAIWKKNMGRTPLRPFANVGKADPTEKVVGEG